MSVDHAGNDAATIAAVLATCVLGGRERTELRMDAPGHIARLSIAHRIAMTAIGERLLPAMRRAALSVQRLNLALGSSDTP
jgi:hypothetical protein